MSWILITKEYDDTYGIHLRFDIQNSSLPDIYKEKLLALSDQRISKDGIIVIKAQKFRSQGKNKEDALNRLKSLILKTMTRQKKRKPTQPSKSAKKKRRDYKIKHGKLKGLRRRVIREEWFFWILNTGLYDHVFSI